MSVAISNVPGLSFGLPELIVITVGVIFMACLCLSDGKTRIINVIFNVIKCISVTNIGTKSL